MKFATVAAASLLAASALFAAVPTAYAAAMTADTDHDGTVDMTEAKTAAMAHFDKADTDHEGTIDSKEAGMDVTAIDPDKNGSLDKSEFETLLGAKFKAADMDNDGTLDAKELASKPGKTVSAMMK